LDGLDGLGDKELIHAALRGDLKVIARYGEEHPGTWAGAWFENEPTVNIVAAFTSDLAQHDAALRPRLRHPERLVIQRRPHSLSALRRVQIERTLLQQATETGRQILTSIGEGKAVIRRGPGGPPTHALIAPLTQITIVPRARPHGDASF
jgi:hypothetical protein